MVKNVLITICGRAGSKGFRNKNLKIFCGRPLSYYSLSAAQLFMRQRPDLHVDVALNTDSPLLRETVEQGYPWVEYVSRPDELCGDTVPKMAVFQQTLSEMERRHAMRYDVVIDLDITSPMRQEQDVAGQLAVYEQRGDLDVVFSATDARRNPWFNQLKVVGDHVEKVIESPYTARQQAPAVYDINASIYVLRRDFLANNTTGILWDGKCGMYKMFDTGVVDIDSEEDYLLMEAIAQHLYAVYPHFAAIPQNIPADDAAGAKESKAQN